MDIKEMLDILGYRFRSLSLHTGGRWIAKGKKEGEIHWTMRNGKTPEEALEKLLTLKP